MQYTSIIQEKNVGLCDEIFRYGTANAKWLFIMLFSTSKVDLGGSGRGLDDIIR